MTYEPRVPVPQGGASLMLAFQSKNKNVLILGDNTIAANRVLSCLEADATVYLISNPQFMCAELEYRVSQGQAILLGHQFEADMLNSMRFDLGFICQVNQDSIESVVHHFRQHHIPVNVTDRSELSDFFMTSTYRDQSLQVAVSTNGQASKLSSRIRRHIASSLPHNLGEAINRMGRLRKKVRASDPSSASSVRRMAWLAQICEYWSMDRLAQLSDKDMAELLESYHHDEGYESLDGSEKQPQQITRSSASQPMGSIALVGSGTGDPELLTIAAYKAIKEADLVLSDKIVPEEVVALVECELKIARKFPGNADAAQQEFNELALHAVRQGKKVVRLKQGDPYLFGRGGEEVLFFRQHGIVPRVIPGISSTVAAGLVAGIPLTHRGVASQFLVTTGTGARNSSAPLPIFDQHRTDVFLMAIHRLEALTKDLMATQQYPPDIPCAIVERASCKDQRVIWGQLSNIVQILDDCGGSRPPGLLIVGRAINVLKHENKGVEGVASNLMTASGLAHDVVYGESDIKVADANTQLLQLHDPEYVF
ncbi:putative uroporphyrinogen-III C-methyltransferase [Choanephora cucurbitarum]|uniref:Putative uroporphyrinogen-III C-methyltransferase n=1 Tax=Choanephora cucurbitarum TaxID=101091 RepID=A0A1C7N971_9FUNG|nr:putative uroporphyrinogen-III C-methyltransferase [Choanephora cucurbitarum]